MSEDQKWQMLSNWMSIIGPVVGCNQIHLNSTCISEILKKFFKVMQTSSRLYLVLHLLPFMIFKFNKLKRQKKLSSGFLKLFKNFIGSLLFMSCFVGNFKFMLCFINQNKQLAYTIPFISAVNSLSILFEQQSRSEQIIYFALVRALRSSYIFLKRRGYCRIIFEQSLAFIALFGLLSYLYHHHSQLLKNSEIFKSIWGIA